MTSTTRSSKPPATVAITPNGTTPAPYVVDRQYEWVCCETEDCAGFCAEVRRSLTVAERDRFMDEDDAISAYSDSLKDVPVNEWPSPSPRERELVLVAPLVRAWNAQASDAVTGEASPLPVPGAAVNGGEVWRMIPHAEATWLIVVVKSAVRLGKRPRLIATFYGRRSDATAGTASAGSTGDRSGKATRSRSRRGSSSGR